MVTRYERYENLVEEVYNLNQEMLKTLQKFSDPVKGAEVWRSYSQDFLPNFLPNQDTNVSRWLESKRLMRQAIDVAQNSLDSEEFDIRLEKLLN